VCSSDLLSYTYNPAFNAALKGALSFPQVKFDGRTKMWSIMDDEAVLNKAVKALEDAGAFFDDTLTQLRGDHTFTAKPQGKKVTATTATLRGSSVVLQWPYISEPHIRTAVMGAVKQTQGRKCNPDTTTWSVGLSEAARPYRPPS